MGHEANSYIFAFKILKELYSLGVQEICICAGARNAPFLSLLSIEKHPFKVYSFFEERSAGFFALGRIKSSGKPVAVITTSGTAVANLLPPVVEAFYQSLPLVAVSSDRPKRYRGSGSPQSIEQKGIFSHYVGLEYDYDAHQNQMDFKIQNQPIHLNICFEDQLVPMNYESFWREEKWGIAPKKQLKNNHSQELHLYV